MSFPGCSVLAAKFRPSMLTLPAGQVLAAEAWLPLFTRASEGVQLPRRGERGG
jgi:hypothetical protein